MCIVETCDILNCVQHCQAITCNAPNCVRHYCRCCKRYASHSARHCALNDQFQTHQKFIPGPKLPSISIAGTPKNVCLLLYYVEDTTVYVLEHIRADRLCSPKLRATGLHERMGPGGAIDVGETPAEAAVREADEEAGIVFHDSDDRIKRLTPDMITPVYQCNDNDLVVFIVVYIIIECYHIN